MSDRRAALEAAFDNLSGEDDDTTVLDGTGDGEGAPGSGRGEEEQVVDDSLPEIVEETAEEKTARERDESGKFKKKDDLAASKLPKELPLPGEKLDKTIKILPQPKPGPVSWRPEVRGKFGTLSADVQEEITRRDKEVDTALRSTAAARQYATQMHQIISPYEAMIRAEGGNAHTAVDSLLKTAYHLRTANPQQKAQMVAKMIMQHAVDPELLDQALAARIQGKQASFQTDPMMQHLQRELAPMKEFFNGLQTRQQSFQQEQVGTLQGELETFQTDPKNEFITDVSGDMADLMELAANRGVKMSLQDAYKRATLAHPTIGPIIAQRQMQATAAQRTAAARRARNASASLPSGGAPAGAGESSKPLDRRAQLEAAWDKAASGE